MTRLGTKAPRIHIPDCHWYTNASDTPWWATSLPHFPPQTRAYNAMCSDLIPPLPQARRIGLVDNYCPERLRDEIKKSGTNSDCIARLYLGRRREGRQSRFFSLRNYPLWLDQAEQLGLPVEKYTKIMAQTLAMMHFEAKIDANDVEFVLGSPPLDREAKLVPSRKIAVLPCNTGTRGTRTIQLSEHSRPSHAQDNGAPDLALWLLDFDCCGAITMDEVGMEIAALAFYRNDPYFPRPGSQLWDVFSEHYKCAGREMLAQGPDQDLPVVFVGKLCALQKSPMNRSKAQSVNCDSPSLSALLPC